jgi:hypothetical protein
LTIKFSGTIKFCDVAAEHQRRRQRLRLPTLSFIGLAFGINDQFR